MLRSWAYILMFAATFAGVVALLWPSPEVRTIEEIAMPARPVARPDTPKPKQAANKAPGTAKREAAPAPAAVVKKMPAPNTTTRRQTAQPENGMQPSPLQRLGSPLERAAQAEAAKKGTQPPPRPAMPARPGSPPRPSAGQVPGEPVAR
jgi:hypothetical protein